MWKDVPVLFFPSKQGEKTWQTGLKFCLPPIAHPSWKNAEFGYTRYGYPVLHGKKKTAKIFLTLSLLDWVFQSPIRLIQD